MHVTHDALVSHIISDLVAVAALAQKNDIFVLAKKGILRVVFWAPKLSVVV